MSTVTETSVNPIAVSLIYGGRSGSVPVWNEVLKRTFNSSSKSFVFRYKVSLTGLTPPSGGDS